MYNENDEVTLKIIDKYYSKRDDIEFHNNLKYYSFCKLYGNSSNNIMNLKPMVDYHLKDNRSNKNFDFYPGYDKKDLVKGSRLHDENPSLIKNPFAKDPIKHKKTCKFYDKYNKDYENNTFECKT